MRRCCWCCLFALLLSACNLDSAPNIPPTQPAPNISRTAPVETAAPPTSDAIISPTRTNFADSVPTPLPILASAQAPTNIGGARAAFSSPLSGALVGSPLVISGTVSGLGSGQFTLVLLDASGAELVRQPLTVQAAVGVRDVPFAAALSPGRYTGNAELRLVAADANHADITLASVAVVIVPSSSSSDTSAGGTSYGGFTNPASGSVVTGDPILISGTAGGFPETTFTLALITPSGTVINQQPISLTGQETAPVAWTAVIGTGGYRGQVEVRAFMTRESAPVLIASMTITLG